MDLIEWLNQQIAMCDNILESDIKGEVALQMMRLMTANSEIDECLMGLRELDGMTSTVFTDYKEDKYEEFQDALDDGYELVPTGIMIPDLPDDDNLTPD